MRLNITVRKITKTCRDLIKNSNFVWRPVLVGPPPPVKFVFVIKSLLFRKTKVEQKKLFKKINLNNTKKY